MPPKAVSFLAIALVAIIFITFVILQVIPPTIPPPLTAGPALPMGTVVPDDGTETDAPPPAPVTSPVPAGSPTPSAVPPATAPETEPPSKKPKDKTSATDKLKRDRERAAELLGIAASSIRHVEADRLVTVLGDYYAATAIVFSPKRPELCAIASTQRGITLWDFDAGTCTRRLAGDQYGQTTVDTDDRLRSSERGMFTSLAFHPTEALLLAGTSDGYVVAWNYETQGDRQILAACAGPVTDLAFRSDGEAFALAGTSSDLVRTGYRGSGQWYLEAAATVPAPLRVLYDAKDCEVYVGTTDTIYRSVPASGRAEPFRQIGVDPRAGVLAIAARALKLLRSGSKLRIVDIVAGRSDGEIDTGKRKASLAATDPSLQCIAIVALAQGRTEICFSNSRDDSWTVLFDGLDPRVIAENAKMVLGRKYLAVCAERNRILVWRID